MTKAHLVERIAKDARVSKRAAMTAVNTFINETKSTLAKGGKVTLTGFGTFMVSQRAARRGVNPQTGTEITIPAMKVPKFKAGKALRGLVK